MSYKNRTGLPTFGSDGPSEAEMIKSMVENVDAVVSGHQRIDSELSTLKSDVVSLRRMAGAAGASGTSGVAAGPVSEAQRAKVGEFAASVAARKLGVEIGGLSTKAAALLELDTDARGGNLTSPEVHNIIDAVYRPYGSVLAACRRVQVPVGQEIQVPYFSLAPTAAWQGGEGTALDEQDITVGALNRRCEPVGGWSQFSFQLANNGSFDAIGQVVLEQVAANKQQVETGLIAGDGSTNSPWTGLLEVSGAQDQPAAATPTSALLSKFLADSFEDAPALFDNGTLLVAPHVAEIVARDDSSGNYTTRVVYGLGGKPELYFGRWRVVTSPAVGSNFILADMSKVWLLDGGSSILLDEKSGSRNLIIYATTVNWAAWGVTLPSQVSRCAITSLT